MNHLDPSALEAEQAGAPGQTDTIASDTSASQLPDQWLPTEVLQIQELENLQAAYCSTQQPWILKRLTKLLEEMVPDLAYGRDFQAAMDKLLNTFAPFTDEDASYVIEEILSCWPHLLSEKIRPEEINQLAQELRADEIFVESRLFLPFLALWLSEFRLGDRRTRSASDIIVLVRRSMFGVAPAQTAPAPKSELQRFVKTTLDLLRKSLRERETWTAIYSETGRDVPMPESLDKVVENLLKTVDVDGIKFAFHQAVKYVASRMDEDASMMRRDLEALVDLLQKIHDDIE